MAYLLVSLRDLPNHQRDPPSVRQPIGWHFFQHMGECPSHCTCPVRYPFQKSVKKLLEFYQKRFLISFNMLKPIRKPYMSAVEIACPRSYAAFNEGVQFCSFQVGY